MDEFDEDLAAFLGEETPNILYPESNPSSSSVISRSSPTTDLCPSSYPEPKQMAIEPPSKQKKPNDHHLRMPTFHSTSSTPIILNFSNVNSPQSPQQVNLRSSNQEEKQAVTETFRNSLEARKTARTTKKTSRVRPPSQTYDHIIAERKRREQLSQLFVALSTIVPGLKKVQSFSLISRIMQLIVVPCDSLLFEAIKLHEINASNNKLSCKMTTSQRPLFDNY